MRRLFIMRKDLQMSPGKLAAQVAHCAEAYWMALMRKHVVRDIDSGDYHSHIDLSSEVFEGYVQGNFVKTVCEAKSKNHLLKAKKAAEEIALREGEDFGLIYDNCLTELEPEEPDGTTLTGIWFAPLSDEVAHQISKRYQLYR